MQYVGKAECGVVGTAITTTPKKKKRETTLRRENHQKMKKKKKSNACGLVNRSTWDIIFLVYFPMLSSFIERACITLVKEGML